MNKTYFLPLVLATAVTSVAFADEPVVPYEDVYTNVFTGITQPTELVDGVPGATGATWSTNGVVKVDVDNGAVVFESEEDTAVLKLAVSAEPEDANTIFRVTVTGTVEEVETLMANPGVGVQTAFAVCTNGSAAARCFWAWNGAEWVKLNDVPEDFDGSVPTNLTVEISYQGTNNVRWASFAVGGWTLDNGETNRIALVDGSSAFAANNLTGFGVNGSGTLAAVNGEVMLGVAEYDGVKYGTISGAVAAADAAGEASPEIEVVRETSESIVVPNTIDVTVVAKEEELGSGASGHYEIPLNITGGGNKDVKLPSSIAEYKEIDPGTVQFNGTTVTFDIRTAESVITNAAPGGKALEADGGKLRTFLATYVPGEYEAAKVTSSKIADAINTNGVNGIKLYQSYALGIEPTQLVKPVTIDSDTEDKSNITLKIPAIVSATPSGDYTAIKYKVYKDGVVEAVSTANSADAIKIPLGTGSYSVKIDFE